MIQLHAVLSLLHRGKMRTAACLFLHNVQAWQKEKICCYPNLVLKTAKGEIWYFFFPWLLILCRKDTLSIFSFQSWAIGTFSREVLEGTLAKRMPYVLFRGVFQVKGALSLVLKMCCICCWYTSYLPHSGGKPTWCLLAGCLSNVWDWRGQRGTCGHDYCWCRLPWVGAGVALLLLLQG